MIGELLRSSFASSFAFLKAARRCGPCSGAVRVAPSCRRRKELAVRCELYSMVGLTVCVSRASGEDPLEAGDEDALEGATFRVFALLLPFPLLVFRRKTRRDVGTKLPARWLSVLTRS